MKLIIDIDEEVKQTFDNAKNEDLYGNYYDYNSLIGKAIQNGIPLKDKVIIATLMSLVTDKDYKPKLDGKMTGKEKLIQYCQEHTAEEIYEYIKKLFDYSLSWTNSRLFIIGWLEGEEE